MKTLIKPAIAVLFSMALFFAWFPTNTGASFDLGEPNQRPRKHLKPFSSEAELKSFLKKIVRKRRGGGGGGAGNGSGTGDGLAAAPPINAATETVNVTADGASARESITNTQHAGVDEGGIVKLHGDHLVVLRRGRLFTIAIGDNKLKAVSAINAFGPDIDPNDTWYDEMLISENNIVVVGYSYDRGGTEVGLFNIDGEGKLKYRSTYHLRSNDYYSSRNYSSRLVGNKLIFYSPLYLDWDEKDILEGFPALRKWHKGAKESEFCRIVSAEHVYRAEKDVVDEDDLALHTVTTCDLSSYEMTCDAQSVLGPTENVFYVSPKSVYVWASNWDWENEKEHNRSILFRMPLDGTDPSAVRVSGGPVDQFSFLEDDDNQLNVLVRSDSDGDGMWSAEVSEGETALLRLPASSFGDGSMVATASSYRELEKIDGYALQNRFVGNYLLYGTGSGWGPQTTTENKLHLVNWQTGALSTITLSHNVDRLDALGDDGIVVGTNGKDLFFTSIRLDRLPRVIDTYRMKDASQGETRSQGFFYKPDGADSGMLGLPITSAERPGYEQLLEGSASIIFLKNKSLRFSELGLLRSGSVTTSRDDDCKASCVDWYGNARPIFARGRIFALLGYEIVEGVIRSNRVEEFGRLDFSPKQSGSAAR